MAEKWIKNVAIVEKIDGRPDPNVVNWIVEHAWSRTGFQKAGDISMDTDKGEKVFTIFKLTGLGAFRLSKKFAKRFGWGNGAIDIRMKDLEE